MLLEQMKGKMRSHLHILKYAEWIAVHAEYDWIQKASWAQWK